MDLSRSILKNFANTVSPSEKSDKQMFARGTAKIIGEEKYVQLDGSEYLTPISELSDVQNDDRIFVTIENHTATVLGNFTYPIPRTAIAAQERAESSVKYTELESKVGEFNYVKTDALEAQYVKTEVLEAQYVKTEVLEAQYVKTEVLEAQYIKTEVLEADYLNATQIDAKYLSSEYIRANYLSAVEIEANYIKTNQLDAAVGNFGYLKTITVDANIASAVVANLADASIKSALIESLDAGKITNLEINTNKVNVHSDNGHSMWTDNTLLFKDSTRPRVQIGEDASKNYNFYIWDANGNLMFDALGLKEKGITSKIIKDDMIKDDASISAGKLNIKSLFETINNDGSNTIKSNKIYLDEQGQTLDVAFKSITTNPDGSSTIEGTNVDVSLGKISLSTWITKVDNALKKNNTTQTDYSNFEVKIGEISSTVSSHTGQITTVQQTADKINWVVASGSSSSNFTITDRMATLTAKQINLKGLVAFSGLDSDTRTTINNASTDASSAKSTANKANTTADSNAGVIADWCYDNNKSFIDGGKIYAGTITANEIAAGAITADKIAAGAITAGKIAAGAVTADKMSVTSLESICANIGGFNIVKEGNIHCFRSSSNTSTSSSIMEIFYANSGMWDTKVTIGSYSQTNPIGFEVTGFDSANNIYTTMYYAEGHLYFTKYRKNDEEGAHINNTYDMLLISYDGLYKPEGPTNALQFYNNFEFSTSYDNITIGTSSKPSGDHYLRTDRYVYASDFSKTYRLIGASSSGNVIVGFKTKNANSVKIQAGYQKDIVFDMATNTDGTTSSEVFKVFYDTKQKKYIFRSPLIHNYTSSSANQVGVDQYGSLSRYPSSSKRYKENISEKLSSNVDPHGLYNLPVVEYIYKDGYLSENDLRYGQKFIGFIAEDVEKIYPLAANYNSDGLVENWEPNIIIPGMLKLVQEQHTQIDYISRRMDTNEEKIEALQNQLAEAMITIAFQQKQIDILQAAS